METSQPQPLQWQQQPEGVQAIVVSPPTMKATFQQQPYQPIPHQQQQFVQQPYQQQQHLPALPGQILPFPDFLLLPICCPRCHPQESPTSGPPKVASAAMQLMVTSPTLDAPKNVSEGRE
ncbi:uncharacterized protein [Palaemon carinicauda]|uniref:uncharacterized protein n=1 Tax=Palaemon carinicauda TaxID=392227 RepID=UPI0035B5C837